MKFTTSCCALVFLVFCCIGGCGKKSGLEGKILDGKGKPIAGVKVVAKQVVPLKGYDQFQTITGTDGVFTFNKLYPSTAYELITYSLDDTRNRSLKIESGPDGQTKLLSGPIKLRFQC